MIELAPSTREKRIVASALWAAAGDALGWITELGRESTVQARTGQTKVNEPIDWVRRVGGKAGVTVPLPAGTYSDDTQLRLGVGRAIRGNGAFDAEAFARIELTAWQGYALGAGLGSKAAAANLTRRGVNWFSNFFDGKQEYTNAGGNGAAMRVQPHAWLKKPGDDLTLSVLRDAIITHGHPHGFAGAVLHATAVSCALHNELLEVSKFDPALEAIQRIPLVISSDRQLDAFWRPAWEQKSGTTLEEAIRQTLDGLREDLRLLASSKSAETGAASYSQAIEVLGLRTTRFRGSGLKTALAASFVASIFRDDPVGAIVTTANELGSDTDTIGTMAGAIVGAAGAEYPHWPLQDQEYIEREARRIANIANGQLEDSFTYPDLARWKAPSNQSNCIAVSPSGFVLVGLGNAEPFGEQYESGDAIWQWMRLSFGQTILAKRRRLPSKIGPGQLPGERRMATAHRETATRVQSQPELAFAATPQSAPERNFSGQFTVSIDQITDQVIGSDFDPLVIGRAFNHLVERGASIEHVVMFTSIVAKARIARLRRRSR